MKTVSMAAASILALYASSASAQASIPNAVLNNWLPASCTAPQALVEAQQHIQSYYDDQQMVVEKVVPILGYGQKKPDVINTDLNLTCAYRIELKGYAARGWTAGFAIFMAHSSGKLYGFTWSPNPDMLSL